MIFINSFVPAVSEVILIISVILGSKITIIFYDILFKEYCILDYEASCMPWKLIMYIKHKNFNYNRK